MKLFAIILLTISIYAQDSVFVADSHVDTHQVVVDTLLLTYISDTTHYNYIFYLDSTSVRCEPGIIIRSGMGCEYMIGFFDGEPKIEIFTDSGVAIQEKKLLYYYK